MATKTDFKAFGAFLYIIGLVGAGAALAGHFFTRDDWYVAFFVTGMTIVLAAVFYAFVWSLVTLVEYARGES